MDATNDIPKESNAASSPIHGSGSVAHQIIGEFISALAESAEYSEIAQKLSAAIFDSKPTESALRKAMFGDDSL